VPLYRIKALSFAQSIPIKKAASARFTEQKQLLYLNLSETGLKNY